MVRPFCAIWHGRVERCADKIWDPCHGLIVEFFNVINCISGSYEVHGLARDDAWRANLPCNAVVRVTIVMTINRTLQRVSLSHDS